MDFITFYEIARDKNINFSFHHKVLDSRYDMDDYNDNSNIVQKRIAPIETICITPNEYYGLVTAIVGLAVLLSSVVVLSLLIYR